MRRIDTNWCMFFDDQTPTFWFAFYNVATTLLLFVLLINTTVDGGTWWVPVVLVAVDTIISGRRYHTTSKQSALRLSTVDDTFIVVQDVDGRQCAIYWKKFGMWFSMPRMVVLAPLDAYSVEEWYNTAVLLKYHG